MTTTLKEEAGNLVVSFEGRLDTAASAEVEKSVHPLYDCEGHDIILDCSKLEYISSSGLRIFLGILKAAKAKGSRVFTRGLNADLQKVFDMTGFSNLFEKA